jgi:hypothetical protein
MSKLLKYSELEGFLSSDRLSTFLNLAQGNQERCIGLYIQNIQISEKLHTLLNEFEVVFRNVINDVLSARYGDEWYNSREIEFIDKHITAIQRVKQDLHRENKPKTNSNIISNLTLGFWVYLFNKDYDQTLWRLELYKIFKHRRISRSKVREELHKIKNLRNRVAHCECILKYPHKRYYKEIIEFISWINPEISEWVEDLTKLD